MVQLLTPGIKVIEQEQNLPVITGGTTDVGGFVGTAEKGPVDVPVLIQSFSEFSSVFGGIFSGSFLWHSVRAFFQQGGQQCYVARVIGSASAASTVTLLDHAGINTLTIDATNDGVWGYEVFIKTNKVTAETTAALMSGNTSLTLNTVAGFEVGDLVQIADATTTVNVIVLSIDLSTRTLNFPSVGAITTIPTGSVAATSSMHRVRTTLAEDLETGDTEALLTNGANVRLGQQLVFASALEQAKVIVTGINGNKEFFSAVALGVTIVSGSLAVSAEFRLEVLFRGTTEIHEFLSMEDGYAQDYVENRLSGTSNASNIITVTDEDSATLDLYQTLPGPTGDNVKLASGDNGGAVGDNEYIGTDVAPPSGIFLMNQAFDVDFISTPGVTSVAVIQNGDNYATNRGDIMYIANVPLADDEPEEAREFRLVELQTDSSFGALYYPFLTVPDPQVSGGTIQVPTEGHVQGQWARTSLSRGVHVAPANFPLSGVLGVTRNVSDTEQEVLNPNGINAIREFRGRGVRIFGARTLQSLPDGRHYINVRRTLNFIKRTIKEQNQDFVFNPNDTDLFDRLRSANSTFLRRLWENGVLVPRNDPDKAFFVKVDSETTTPADQDAGIVNVEIGVSIVKPAEFIV